MARPIRKPRVEIRPTPKSTLLTGHPLRNYVSKTYPESKQISRGKRYNIVDENGDTWDGDLPSCHPIGITQKSKHNHLRFLFKSSMVSYEKIFGDKTSPAMFYSPSMKEKQNILTLESAVFNLANYEALSATLPELNLPKLRIIGMHQKPLPPKERVRPLETEEQNLISKVLCDLRKRLAFACFGGRLASYQINMNNVDEDHRYLITRPYKVPTQVLLDGVPNAITTNNYVLLSKRDMAKLTLMLPNKFVATDLNELHDIWKRLDA